MRTILPEVEQDALEAWVYEHADEFDNVALYKEGLTMYRVGLPPTTVAHHHGRIIHALNEALASRGTASRRLTPEARFDAPGLRFVAWMRQRGPRSFCGSGGTV